MKTFEYKGFDHEGRSKRGLIEALDPKEARERLLKRGILAEQLGVVGSRQLRRWETQSPWAWSALYHELAVLIESGLTLSRALDVLIDSPEHSAIQAVLAAVRDRVREGMSLAEALAVSRRTIRPFEKAVIEVGEKSGTLSLVLARLAAFLDEQQQIRERIQSALIYPSIVTAFAFLVAVVMLGFVVPSMARMLQDARIALPALTRFMVALGHGVLWAAGPAIAAGVGAVFYLRNRMSRDEPFRRGMDRGLFRLPVIGEGYSLLVNLRFARTLAILVEGGVPIVEGLSLAGKATGSPWVAHLVDAEAESVRHGSSVADAVRRAGPLSEALPGWIHIGEASGSLQRLLEGAAARYQMQWSRLVARCLSVLEPALILFVGSIVLLVALSILLPVMSLNRAVG